MDDDIRFARQGITLTPMLRRDLELYREHGMEPAWARVHRHGQDVTDEDPETWPWPWKAKKFGAPGS